jgi:hypothetical protein
MTDNPILTGLLVGQTVVDGFFAPLEQQAAFENGHAQAQAAANSTRINLETQILALQKRLNETYRALVGEQAHAHGQAAMLKALKDQHPDSPLWRDSGKRYKDGDVKPAIALIFEQAHDAHIAKYGAQVGIIDPTELRAD